MVLTLFLMACSQVGTIKSMGIFLEDISLSLGTTSTDIGVSLGLFTAFSYFPGRLDFLFKDSKDVKALTYQIKVIVMALCITC